jgi:hypothetical protein
VRILYIAGMSHSGSTLLNLMLNAHPQIISVGELIDLGRRTGPQDTGRRKFVPCSCGAPSLWDCEFWSSVNARLMDQLGKSLSDLDILSDRSLDFHAAHSAVVLRAISEVSGRTFIVDSSKRPGRLAYLMQINGLEVYPIHLIREARGQIFSLLRKNGGFFQQVYSYVRVHNQIRKITKGIPHGIAHYEDLVRSPQPTLSRLLRPLGIEFDPNQLEWGNRPHHTLGGNKLRWQPRRLVLDERWRDGLSRPQQLITGLLKIYARHWLPTS